MEAMIETFTPELAVRHTLENRRRPDPLQERNELRQALDRIERRILSLWKRLDAFVEGSADESIRTQIRLIREDERQLIQICVARVDPWDPDLEIGHDLTNNDFTLSLREKLALASAFNCTKRIRFLHRMQRIICERLKELGIDVSRN
ncbi:MAG: hypothetical protein PHS73_02110 [Candidatus Peribacteraceae bacterium]|nr:hypothetical protein [Candidatus Peribacteraceae bacterium]